MTPNLFPEQKEPSERDIERKKADSRGNMANVPQDGVKQKNTDNSPPEDETSSTRRSSPVREAESKENAKPKGMFSWLGNWRKVDK